MTKSREKAVLHQAICRFFECPLITRKNDMSHPPIVDGQLLPKSVKFNNKKQG
jgi:hypothetical protein